MEDQTPQEVPQNARKMTAGGTAGGGAKTVFNGGTHYHYADKDASGYEVTIAVSDLVSALVLMVATGGLIYCFILAALSVYSKLVEGWAWVAANWIKIAIGGGTLGLIGGFVFWYVITFTKDSSDEELV